MNNVMRPHDNEAPEYIGDLMLDGMVGDAGVVHSVHAGGADQRERTEHQGLSLDWVGDRPAVLLPSRQKLRIKRLFDVTCAALALVVLAPLLVVVATVVAGTSPGPVLFRQQREGRDGELFWALKFRSMHSDCCDPSGLQQASRNDPRLTPCGGFLRRTSLDELPQLFNVLRGEMSLVGPRPHVPGMLAAGMPFRELVPYYEQRLIMRPGITGWAQANGLRGSTDNAVVAQARVDFDLAYIQNFSVWLDLKILLLTARNQFLSGSGH